MKKSLKKLLTFIFALGILMGLAVTVHAATDAVEDYSRYGMRVIRGGEAEIAFYVDYDGYVKGRVSLYIYDEDMNLVASIENDPLDYNGEDVEWYGYTMDTTDLTPGVYGALIIPEYHNATKWMEFTEEAVIYLFEVVNADSSLNGIAQDVNGNYKYYKNGQVDTSYTGFDDLMGYLYVKNGVVDPKFFGAVKDPKDGKIKYVSYGEWDDIYEGVAEYDGVTYYLSDGAIDYSYEGIYMPYGTTYEYYVYNGIAVEACPVTHVGHQMHGAACIDCGKSKFVDVHKDDFYYTPVGWAVMNEITQGTSSTTFSPDDACTRAQVVTFLWRAAGFPEPSGTAGDFVDVPADQWYAKAVQWAVENNITQGVGNNRFDPNATCTRGQIVTFLHRAAGNPIVVGDMNEMFTDVPEDQWYAAAVNWAVANSITQGTGNGKFRPDATCTRGQIVTFLHRYYME